MLLLIPLVALAATALLIPALERRMGRETGWVVAGVFAALAVLVGLQGPTVLGGEPLETSLSWFPTLGIGLSLRMDGTGWLFAMLVLGIGALIMAYATRYFPPGRRLGFYLLMTVFAVAMLGLVLADDVVLMFVFWELTTVCSFYLIGLSGESASRAAIRTFLLTALGGLGLLAAVVLLWVDTGTTRLSEIIAQFDPTARPGYTVAVALLLILAAFTKSAQFPFHYWLPDAMAASTPVSAYLHAAAMVKAGIYLLMRFTPLFGDVPVWNVLLIGVGLFTAVLGAIFALQRSDLKELLAYSTVSQLGLLVAVIGVGTPKALSAAGIHVLAHALFKSALFMLVGVIDVRAGTRDIHWLSGLRRTMPVTSTLLVLASLSMAGVPPLLGFVSKETIFGAFLEAPGPAWTGPLAGGAAVLGAVLTFAYSFRIVRGALAGPPPTDDAPREASPAFLLGPALTATAGLLLGAVVPLLDPLANAIVLDTTLQEYSAHLVLWHGLEAPLFMSMVAIGVGALLGWQHRPVGHALDRKLFPLRGTHGFEVLHKGVIRGGVRVGDLTRSDQPTPYLAAILVSLAVVAVGVLVADPQLAPPPAPSTNPKDWLLVLLLAVSVGALVATRTRLAAIALIGVAGFGVAVWFLLLGGYDLALTQLLVEILTVVIAVLVLRRLPRKFRAPSRTRRNLAALLAVGSGVIAGTAAFVFTGRRELSGAAEYYLTNVYEDTGGTNVVNTILVDYRALDTLGELAVLGVAGLIIVALLQNTHLNTGRLPATVAGFARYAVFPAGDNAVITRTVARLLAPVLVIWSLWLLLRGHYEPGGGFIASLVGAAGFSLAYLAAADAARARIRWPYVALIASGVAVAAGAGLIGYLEGSYLRPIQGELLGMSLTTSLIFDVGVYLAVVGVLLTALNKLGDESDLHTEDVGTATAAGPHGSTDPAEPTEPGPPGEPAETAEPAEPAEPSEPSLDDRIEDTAERGAAR